MLPKMGYDFEHRGRFSVETISTIGYGQMSPASLDGSIAMTVEAMFGLILLAASAGVVLGSPDRRPASFSARSPSSPV
jgi:Ion channel